VLDGARFKDGIPVTDDNNPDDGMTDDGITDEKVAG
jgi:hypothetical protein